MNGYPDEKTLKQIETWDGKDPKEMINWIKEAWNYDYGIIMEETVESSLKDYVFVTQKFTRYTLVTGGWSGNEDIIIAININRLFDELYWQRSERGGMYVYEVNK